MTSTNGYFMFKYPISFQFELQTLVTNAGTMYFRYLKIAVRKTYEKPCTY